MVKFSASLRIMGHDLEPEEISRHLALEPSVAHRRGDPHLGKGGRYADFREGLWALNSSLNETRPLAEHLQDLKLQLGGKESFLNELRARGYRLDLYVGVFEIGDGDEVPLAVLELKILADLGVDVCFDLYTSQ